MCHAKVHSTPSPPFLPLPLSDASDFFPPFPLLRRSPNSPTPSRSSLDRLKHLYSPLLHHCELKPCFLSFERARADLFLVAFRTDELSRCLSARSTTPNLFQLFVFVSTTFGLLIFGILLCFRWALFFRYSVPLSLPRVDSTNQPLILS